MMLKVTRSIVGLKKEESEALLNFLLLHAGRGIDYQARVRWAPKTVVVWDVSYHSLCVSFVETDISTESRYSTFRHSRLEDRRETSFSSYHSTSRTSI